MYSRGAFILSMCFLTVCKAGGSMAGDENANEPLNDLDAGWPVKVIKCFDHEHVLQCFSSLLQEKTRAKDKVSVGRGAPSSGNLTIRKTTALLDLWEKALYSQIMREVSEMSKMSSVLNSSDLAIRFLGESNGIFRTALDFSQETEVARKMKTKMSMKNVLPFVLVPGLFLAGIMPWVMPPLKILVTIVGLMNQVAFSTALFSLVRGYIFDTTQNEHIFYINHGYLNEKHHQKHQGVKTHDVPIKSQRLYR